MNDSLDNLFAGDTGPVKGINTDAGQTSIAPARIECANTLNFKSAERRFEENCSKCSGTGIFRGWSGRTSISARMVSLYFGIITRTVSESTFSRLSKRSRAASQTTAPAGSLCP